MEELKKSDPTKHEYVTTNLLATHDDIDEENGWVLYTWYSTKWYAGMGFYPDIDWLMDFLGGIMKVITNVEDLPFTFIKVGEDMGDIEMLGNCDNPFGLWWKQSLDFDNS